MGYGIPRGRDSFGYLRDSWGGFSSSTLAIGLPGKAHLFAFFRCPLDLLRVGVSDQHAKSHPSLHGAKSPPLVRPRSRRTGHVARRRTAIGPSQAGSSSDGLALSGRCALRRRDGIGGASWPLGDGHSLSGWAVSDTIQSGLELAANRRVAYVSSRGQKAVQSVLKMSCAKSSPPIGASSKC